MRSPIPTPGRNRLLENIWQAITNFARTAMQGQQRPRSQSSYYGGSVTSEDYYYRRYDLEIKEPIVRVEQRTRELVEMVEHCPEVATAVDIRTNSGWGSVDGDDQGWDVGMTLNDNETPIDSDVYRILSRLRDEVIGGITLKPAPERLMNFGDAFLELGINTRKNQIERVLFLPTFEMFRIEDRKGQLLGFEQRKSLQDGDPIQFHPLTIVHWRYRRKFLYGRSLFAESIDDWIALREVLLDLRNASRSVGVNPNLHEMPCDYSDEDLETYKQKYEERKAKGIVTEFYLMNGANVRKLSTLNPDFKGLLDIAQFYRNRIAMRSGVPIYLLGIPWGGAQDIAQQPSLSFARSINSDRQIVTDGIKHLCNLELALNGYGKEKWQYRIIWPKIYVNPFEEQANPLANESNSIGIEDLDNNGHMVERSPKDYLSTLSEDAIRKQLELLKIG